MLQLIRSKASSWVIKILFVVLVVSFGIWGIGDILRTKTTEVTVAHVGDQTITAEAFQREYQQQYKRTAAAFGNQFNADLARQLGLPTQVLDQMVSQALFAELANRLGLRAPDDVLTSILGTIPLFKNEQGQFDRARFGAYLQQLGMSEESYIETLRRQLLISQIYGAIAAGANPPQQLVDAVYGYRNEKRIADTVLVTDASLPAPPTPDDATLEKYLKEHADRFQAPEYRKLTILRLRPETLAAGIKISDDQITQYFAVTLPYRSVIPALDRDRVNICCQGVNPQAKLIQDRGLLDADIRVEGILLDRPVEIMQGLFQPAAAGKAPGFVEAEEKLVPQLDPVPGEPWRSARQVCARQDVGGDNA